MDTTLSLTVSELSRALQHAKRHLIVSQLVISTALVLALKVIH